MKKIICVLAIFLMASVASAQTATSGITWPSEDIPYVLDWITNAAYAQVCYQPAEDGGLGYALTVAGKKQCLAYLIKIDLDRKINAWISNKDADVAAAAARESAHTTNATVVVE